MHTIKIVAVSVGAIVLILGSMVVSIAALWGRPRNRRRKDDKVLG